MRFLHLRIPTQFQSDFITLIIRFNSLMDFKVFYLTDGLSIFSLIIESQNLEVQSNEKTISIYGPSLEEESQLFLKYISNNLDFTNVHPAHFYIHNLLQ